jgi:hypothetical protein
MIHERGYWLDKSETDTHLFDKPLCDALIEGQIHGYTWVDIGCGNGAYTMAIRAAGINCIGFDGSPLTYELTNGLCKVADFSFSVDIGKYDIVLCLEVGEHIPKEYEQTFINNLCRASKRIIILSWAIEGQPGTGHVNTRNNDYIIDQMRMRGFMYCAESSQHLKDLSTLPWFKNTILIFQLSWNL